MGKPSEWVRVERAWLEEAIEDERGDLRNPHRSRQRAEDRASLRAFTEVQRHAQPCVPVEQAVEAVETMGELDDRRHKDDPTCTKYENGLFGDTLSIAEAMTPWKSPQKYSSRDVPAWDCLRVHAKLLAIAAMDLRTKWQDKGAEAHKLREQVARLREALEIVNELVNESHGLDGYHRKGDVAGWGEFAVELCMIAAALAATAPGEAKQTGGKP